MADASVALSLEEKQPETLDALLVQDRNKELLRILTCGSVDDGKSTLIGRLLYDSQLIFQDHLAEIESESLKACKTQDEFDFSRLVDSLRNEREHGITIDVTYRFFSTGQRNFIIANAPGHEQYARKMVTGAVNYDLAIVLVDANTGVLSQTRWHSYMVSLLGIRNVVFAINKMDQVGYSQNVFNDIVNAYQTFTDKLGFNQIAFIPVSALEGDNVASSSGNLAWYQGPDLLNYIETVDLQSEGTEGPFRFPVQSVIRLDGQFRGYAGTIAGGSISRGDQIVVQPSGQSTSIEKIIVFDGETEAAKAGEAVTLKFVHNTDVSRGDVIVTEHELPELSDQILARIIWMGKDPMLPSRPYIFKCGHQMVTGSISSLKFKIDIDTLSETAAKTLEQNDIGACNISFNRPIVFDAYNRNRKMGGFLIVDKLSNATVGAGLIEFGLRRATNIHWQALEVNKRLRAKLKNQSPCCLWFTGLSGSGKSTISNLVEQKLNAMGYHTYILDGDNVRHGLNKDLGFTDADRVENIRRISETAKLFVDAGLIVMVSFISPFRSERRMARELFQQQEFLEIFVDTPLEVCEQRDPKGLYKKARAGEIKNFTGIDSTYEPPERADIVLNSGKETPETLVDQLIQTLENRELI